MLRKYLPTRCDRVLLLLALALVPAMAEERAMDTAKSTMTVRVDKAGVLSVLGHDHTISAPIAAGTMDTAARTVSLRVKAASLKVVDEKVSEKDRAEIQKTMVGPEVLDAGKYPEIEFRSTAVEGAGAGAWKVTGNLTLHGETKPITVEVQEKDGHYTGRARLKQSTFGITPVKVAGGTVRVKDEIRIEFDIQPAR